jgi:hypothetical protein
MYQDIFWGYEITYPDFWIHRHLTDTDYFTAAPDYQDPLYEGPDHGQIAIRGEWNWARKDIKPLWSEYIGMIAGLIGAKDIGSAPWKLGDAIGMEAEIVLPKKDPRRLWTGILSHEFCVLHFMVTHPKEIRATFEPLATSIISSLKFIELTTEVPVTPEGIPIPPGYIKTDPWKVINEIEDPSIWYAYDGDAEIGALQSFYLREFPRNNWEISEYIPFTQLSDLGFARYKLKKGSRNMVLGLMPGPGNDVESSHNHTKIVYKESVNY